MREIKKDEYQPQGHLEMWLDMVDHLDALKPAYKLYMDVHMSMRTDLCACICACPYTGSSHTQVYETNHAWVYT